MNRALIVLVVLVVLIYGLFEARRLLEGPDITITSPLPGVATSAPAILIEGTAKNIAFLTINDKPSFTDEGGHFKQLLSGAPGYTVVSVAAVDRFGRRARLLVPITILNFCPVERYG